MGVSAQSSILTHHHVLHLCPHPLREVGLTLPSLHLSTLWHLSSLPSCVLRLKGGKPSARGMPLATLETLRIALPLAHVVGDHRFIKAVRGENLSQRRRGDITCLRT